MNYWKIKFSYWLFNCISSIIKKKLDLSMRMFYYNHDKSSSNPNHVGIKYFLTLIMTGMGGGASNLF